MLLFLGGEKEHGGTEGASLHVSGHRSTHSPGLVIHAEVPPSRFLPFAFAFGLLCLFVAVLFRLLLLTAISIFIARLLLVCLLLYIHSASI